MAEDDAPAFDPDAGPEAAFALVSNEIRAEIIRVLGEHVHEPLTFSQLREEAETDVPSSQFNYHLQQLVGSFVQHTDEGYSLRPEGATLYRSIVAGTITRSASIDSLDAGFDCYFCDGTVRASYDRARISIQCSDCDHQYHLGRAPPSVADLRTERELLESVSQFSRHNLLSFARGVCARCATPVDVEWRLSADTPFEDVDEIDIFAVCTCPNCGAGQYMTTGTVLLRDPGLISFCYDHGIDVTTVEIWELEFAMTDQHTEIESRDPWRVAFDLSLDDERLRLVLDEDLSVLERERT